MEKVCVLFVIGANAWQDVKKREIHSLITILAAVLGLLNLAVGSGAFQEQMIPISIAGMFLGLSVLSQGGIGMGDAWLLLTVSLVLPVQEYLLMLCLAFFSSALWALFLLVVRKQGKKAELPFVPFLLVGYVGGLALCI